MKIFGYELKKSKDQDQLQTFDINKELTADGVALEGLIGGGINTFSIEAAYVPTDEIEFITTYRRMAIVAEIDEALQEIRNEVFIFDVPGERAFELSFTEHEDAPSEAIQKKIQQEFHNVYDIMDFHNRGTQIFDDWYVDSKLYAYKIIDSANPKEGIKKIDFIDPLKIRKIRIIPQPDREGLYDQSKIKDVYVYAPRFDPKFAINQVTDIHYGTSVQGLQINPDNIAYVNSGLFDRAEGRYIGYLNKAILPWNNLRMMEDAMLIFRVVRAPQRRVIYIDVSSMQKNKAEAYMKDMMARFKTKMTYDTKTGSLADRRNIMSMMEDYWLPRKDGGKGTEIENLDGQDTQNMIEEVEYYKDRLWRALNVPKSRFDDSSPSFIFGKGIEIQRDEYRFKKFLDKLRQHFMRLFDDVLRTQLILKNIITPQDWDEIRRYMYWSYSEDNAFVEYKEAELINSRMMTLMQVDPYVGKYFSKDWVRRKILRQTDEEIEIEDQSMESEPPSIQDMIDMATLNSIQNPSEGSSAPRIPNKRPDPKPKKPTF